MRSRLNAFVLAVAAASPVALAQSLDQSRALANDLYSDAATRTSALQPVAAPLAPKVGGYFATRFNANFQSGNPGGDSSPTTGFQMAYTKLGITGNVVDEAWAYGIQIKFNEFDGNAVLDDAWGSLKMEDQWNVKWGQFKLPLLREESISDTKQLAANRSVTNSVFSQSRSQGVMVTYSGDSLRAMGAFSDGLGSRNTDYTATTEADRALTGRAEFKWDGDWKQYDEFTGWRNGAYFGAVGAAAHFQEGGHTVGTVRNNLLECTADVMIKGAGWNVYAAGIWRDQQPPSAVGARTDDFGFIAQVGGWVGPRWELFARYDVVIPDKDRSNSQTFNAFTIGGNRYLVPESHAAKLTIDLIWFPNQQSQGIVAPSTLTGVLAGSRENQVAFQAQLQIVF